MSSNDPQARCLGDNGRVHNMNTPIYNPFPEAPKSDTLKPPQVVDAVVPDYTRESSTFDVAQRLIAEECDALKALLLEKNRQYGNSAIDPVRIYSSASPLEQIRVRFDDKLSRIRNAVQTGQKDPEDAKLDVLGYGILERVAERMHRGDY